MFGKAMKCLVPGFTWKWALGTGTSSGVVLLPLRRKTLRKVARQLKVARQFWWARNLMRWKSLCV
jgi:hypothetical protein